MMGVIEMEIPEGAIAEREAQRNATTKEPERALVEWVVYCIKCGELDKAPNGAFMEAVARRHKKDNPQHTVILGTYQGVE